MCTKGCLYSFLILTYTLAFYLTRRIYLFLIAERFGYEAHEFLLESLHRPRQPQRVHTHSRRRGLVAYVTRRHTR